MTHTIARAALLAVLTPLASAQTQYGYTDHKTQNVVVITYDGLRCQEVFAGADETLLNKEHGNVEHLDDVKRDFWRDTPAERREALMPFFWGTLAKEGQVFGNSAKHSVVKVENGKNFSYPGYSEMWCGIADPRIDKNDKVPNPNVNVLEWLEQNPRFKGRVAAFTSWDCFSAILHRARGTLTVCAGPEALTDSFLTEPQKILNQVAVDLPPRSEGVRFDALTFSMASEYVKSRSPRVLYISFDETDDFAHEGKYEDLLRHTRKLDAFVQRLWETLQGMQQYKDKTALLMTTDHGRGAGPKEWRDHGEKVAGSEFIWLAIMGPEVPARGERENAPDLTQSQVAATVGALLGEGFLAATPTAAKPITPALR